MSEKPVSSSRAPPPAGRAFGLTDAAVRRPVTTLMFALMLAVLGAVAVVRLPVDLLPRFELPTVTVLVPFPGTGAEEMEKLVLERLEEAVASVPGLQKMTGRAREGVATLFLEFRFGSDLNEALNEVRVAVERSRQTLPDDIDPPQVFRFDPNQFPVVFVTVSGKQDLREVTRIARDELKPRLSRVPGVAAVDIRGAFDREVRIELFLDKLVDLQIPIDTVVTALSEENVDTGSGKMLEKGREVGIRVLSSKKSPAELESIPVVARGMQVIRIRDIARVVDTTAELMNVSRVNAETAVFLGVRKGDGENTVDVAAGVRAEVERLTREFPQISLGYRVDQSVFIQRSVDGAKSGAYIGGILALAVLLIFLRNFRATLLIGVSIPLSVMATFFVMERLDVTLNLMTLGGLALGVGMLVDNGVVVLESIVHHLSLGRKGADAARAGASEVALAVAASTATTIVIFVPVLFLEGVNRVLYGQLALVVVVALIASLILSLTLVPAFASKLFKGRITSSSGPVMRRVEDSYSRLLARFLDRPLSSVSLAIGLLAASLALLPRVETELLPIPDEGQVNIDITMPMGTPLEETDAIARDLIPLVERMVPEAAKIAVSVGPHGWWSSSTGEAAKIQIELPDREVRPRSTEDVQKAVEKGLPPIPGADVRVRMGGGFMLLRMIRGGGGEDRLEVQVRGEDLEVMGRYAGQLKDAMARIPGVSGATVPPLRGRDEVVIHVDPVRATTLGLSAERTGRATEAYIRGRRVTTLRTTTEDIPVIVRLAPEDRLRTDQLARLPLLAPATGGAVPLGEIARFEPTLGPIFISRDEGARVIAIGAEVRGRAFGDVAADINTVLAELTPPEGVRALLRGEAEGAKSAFSGLFFGAMLALLLVYMVMAAQFESIVAPALVMFSVPFGGIGVMLLFGAHLSTLNVYSFMGIIVLIGIVVNNAIVLVDYAGQLRAEGAAVRTAVELAARRRIRPILMTTITTLLGLLPVALSQKEGAELQGPLARVVVAGITTSTVVTLFLIPVLYASVESWRARRRAKKQ
jgi:HAE1 family hydrophobic/amphiphilic exporter-1